MDDGARDRRGLAVLATGHLWADFLQGAVPALLPFLIAERGYSYAAAGALVLASSIGSSLVQPLFGIASDRLALPWLMPAGLAIGGAGLATVGLTESYAATVAAVAVSGLGVAAFHPEGARYANYVSRAQRGRGMSMFSLGGNAGFALGPLLVTPAVLAFGLHGTLLALIPLWLAAGLLARELGRLRGFAPVVAAGERRDADGTAGRDAWGPFARLASLIGLRSGVFFGLQAFIPIYFAVELGTSEAAGNGALSVMLVAGAVGTYVGGRLVDRLGRRVIVVGSMAALGPLLVLLQFAERWPATLLLAGDRLRRDRELQHHDRDGPGVPAEPARAGVGHHDGRRDRVRRGRGRAARRARRRDEPADRHVDDRRAPVPGAPDRALAAADRRGPPAAGGGEGRHAGGSHRSDPRALTR